MKVIVDKEEYDKIKEQCAEIREGDIVLSKDESWILEAIRPLVDIENRDLVMEVVAGIIRLADQTVKGCTYTGDMDETVKEVILKYGVTLHNEYGASTYFYGAFNH